MPHGRFCLFEPHADMKISRHNALVLGFLCFLVVAYVDSAVIVHQVSLLLLHLLPVLFVTWYVGFRWGIVLAVAMTAARIIPIQGESVGNQYSYYWYIDVLSDFAATLLLVWMQTMLRKAYDRTEKLARFDQLTGCLNRAGFYDALGREIERNKRYGKPFSLVYFDCDNFKSVNDTLGHHAGDALLAEIASVMHVNLRRVDSMGRLGGDEFAVLLPESCTDAASSTVEHLKAQMDEAMRMNHWPVSFSMGIAVYQNPPADASRAMELADGLMYEVKNSGKNNVLLRSF
jgi:diguanylate cyclase (GGDEF)-like protein